MTGHIRKRSKGSWEVKWEAPADAAGIRRTRYRTVKGTKKDAEKELRVILSTLDQGVYCDPSTRTVGEILEIWLNSIARHAVSPRTFERYRELVTLRLIPELGHHLAQRLGVDHIQQLYASWLTNGHKTKSGGLAARTVHHHHKVLYQALDSARKRGWVQRNVAEDVKLPKVERKPMVTLTPVELAQLFEAAEGTWLHAPVVLAGTLGLRRGEVLGCLWDDFDFDRSTLHVQHSLEDTKQFGLRLKTVKTERSRRTVRMPGVLVSALQAHRERLLHQRDRLGEVWQGSVPLVCPTTVGGTWDPKNFSRAFRALVKHAGIPRISFHELRHTHCTHLLRAGTHPKIVSERVGHPTIAITLDLYSHAIPDMQEEAANAVDRLLMPACLATSGGNPVANSAKVAGPWSTDLRNRLIT